MKALVIPELDPVFEVDLHTGGDGARLEQLQQLVGGWIEALPVAGCPDTTCYINEEGKFTRDLNPRATVLLTSTFPTLLPGDYISGPLVVAGFNPARGDDPETGGHTDLPDRVAHRVWALPGADREIRA